MSAVPIVSHLVQLGILIYLASSAIGLEDHSNRDVPPLINRYDGAFQNSLSSLGIVPSSKINVDSSESPNGGQSRALPAVKIINVTLVMLSRKSAKLTWLPGDAFFGREFEIVYTPENSNYKVVISLADPVENYVYLQDLRPYTHYHLIIRTQNLRTGQSHLNVALNFSTTVMSPESLVIPRPLQLSRVQADEVCIVVLVLFVWIGAVYVFFNQWGKIRGIIPYQPAFRKYDVESVDVDDVAALIPPNCHQFDTRQFHLCQRAKTLDEIMANNASVGPYWVHRRNNSTLGINCDIYCHDDPNGFGSMGGGDFLNLRKTKSAESVLCHRNPRIIVNESFDRELCSKVGREARAIYDDEGADDSGDEGQGHHHDNHGQDNDSEGSASDSDDEPGPERGHNRRSRQRKPSHTRTGSQTSTKRDGKHLLEPPTTLKYRPSSSISGESSLANSPGCFSMGMGSSFPMSPSAHRRSMADMVASFLPPPQPASGSRVLQNSKRAFLQAIRSSSVVTSSPPAVILSNYGTSMDSCPSLSPTMMKGSGYHGEPPPPLSPNPNPGYAFYPPASPRIMARQYPTKIRRQTSLVENTIPLTTTLVNRMCKKTPPRGSNNPSWAVTAQQPIIPQAQPNRRSDSDYHRRKYIHYSSESGESVKSAVFHPAASSYYALSRKQRMGSFRSRKLQKQHPIHLSDSENPEFIAPPSHSPTGSAMEHGPKLITRAGGAGGRGNWPSTSVVVAESNLTEIPRRRSQHLERLGSSSSSAGLGGLKSPPILYEVEGEEGELRLFSPTAKVANPSTERDMLPTSVHPSNVDPDLIKRPRGGHRARRPVTDEEQWPLVPETDSAQSRPWPLEGASNPRRDSHDVEMGPPGDRSQELGGENNIFLSVPPRVKLDDK